jgi:hypothetical protein
MTPILASAQWPLRGKFMKLWAVSYLTDALERSRSDAAQVGATSPTRYKRAGEAAQLN